MDLHMLPPDSRPNTGPAHRPPKWPPLWLKMADRCGGSARLRDSLGIKTVKGLSGKINGSIPWTRENIDAIASLCRMHGLPLGGLVNPEAVTLVLVLGQMRWPAPGVTR